MRSVLIVKDFKDNREIIVSWIQKSLKCRTFEALTVADAIKRLELIKFDVIICDYELPDGTGEVIFDYMRHNKIRTPTILFTAHTEISVQIEVPLVHVIKDKNYRKLFDYLIAMSRSWSDSKS